jgi:N-acyl homoserine lactone hydrolase
MGRPVYRIVALRMGEFDTDRASMLLGTDFGTPLRIPFNAFAVDGGSERVIIDTGVHDPAWVNERVGPYRRQEDEDMAPALRRAVGWKPEDVEVVINTHLHYDHCGRNAHFTRARFYVHAAEWEAAAEPLPSQRVFYLPSLYDRSAVDFFAWRFVYGVQEVLPGIVVFPTPGHSVGHQSVAVNTVEGLVVVTGDAANMLDNLTLNVVPGIIADVAAGFRSLAAIRRIADAVVPGHDPRIHKYQDSDFPRVERHAGGSPAATPGVSPRAALSPHSTA